MLGTGGLSVVFGIYTDVFASFILYLYGLAYLSKLMKKRKKKKERKKKWTHNLAIVTISTFQLCRGCVESVNKIAEFPHWGES